LAIVLTKQTYNNQDKYKKTKERRNTQETLKTKPNKTKLTLI